MNAIACCANTTFVIDDKGYLRASGKNDFQQIDELSKEYNHFQKLDLCQSVSASSSSVCIIDWNNTLTVKGIYNISKPIPHVKQAITNDNILVYIDTNDTLHYVTATDIDTGLKASQIAIFMGIFYTDLDNNLFEIDLNTNKSTSTDIKAKQIFSTCDNFAYIDMDDNAFVNGVNTKIKAKKIQFGFNFTVILSLSNELYFRGTNNYNQFGDLPDAEEFTKTNIIATDIACGTYHIAFTDDNGKLHTKGYNYSGQLGVGFSSNTNDTDIQVIDYSNFVPPKPKNKVEDFTSIIKKDFMSTIKKDISSIIDKVNDLDIINTKLETKIDKSDIINIEKDIRSINDKVDKLDVIILNLENKIDIKLEQIINEIHNVDNNMYNEVSILVDNQNYLKKTSFGSKIRAFFKF